MKKVKYVLAIKMAVKQGRDIAAAGEDRKMQGRGSDPEPESWIALCWQEETNTCLQ